MRRTGDAASDRCLDRLRQELPADDFGSLFAALDSNAKPVSAELSGRIPEALATFLRQTTRLPRIDGGAVDERRLERGQRVFMTHAFPSAMALLVKSLPEGYAAPCLSQVLSLSGNLEHHPYRRLLGVLQMLINVTAVGGFAADGKAIITIPKIRLLHAGIRRIVPRELPEYVERYGHPLNLEDMLATVMGFSLLVIHGLQALGIGIEDEEAEDLYYVWRLFAQMMGIHPDGDPSSSEYVPQNLTEAAEFYRSYGRRHYAAPEDNPEGVVLARANLRMLNDLLPQTPLRRLGMKIVPRIYMQILMGKPAMRRVGIQPVRGLFLTKWLLRALPALWIRLWEAGDKLDRGSHFHENLSRIFFQRLIDRGAGGEVTFRVPDTLSQVRKTG